MAEDLGALDVEARDGVVVLTIRRGTKRNAITQHLADQLDAAFARLESDAALRVAIIRGEAPCFSAGTDLRSERSPGTPEGGPYGFVRRRRSKPVIAAVEGYALGGGFEMVLACDLVVAAEDAYFGLPEVRRGVVANCGAFFRAPEKLPPALAMQLLLTGEPIPATRAHQVGLVNELCAPGGTLAAARRLAAAIVDTSPAAGAATLRAAAEERSVREAPLWAITERAHDEAAASPDRTEGIAAFFEGREPRWS